MPPSRRAPPFSLRHPLSIGVGMALAVILLDLITKHLALAHLSLYEPRSVTAFFDLVLVWNRGASFGLGHQWPSMPLVLSLITIGALAYFCYCLFHTNRLSLALSYGLIIGGAAGNLYDRLGRGAVVDFIDIHLYHYHWPAFNVADIAIFLGVLGLAIAIKHKEV